MQTEISYALMCPAGGLSFAGGRRATPEALDSILRFRGEIYEAASEESDLDEHAYHVVGRSEGAIVAYSRILTLANAPAIDTERLLGPEPFAQVLEHLGVRRAECAEGSRWAVAPSVRDGRAALFVITAGWFVASEAGARVSFVCARTSGGQDLLVERVGFRPVPGLGPFPGRGQEPVVLHYCDMSRPYPKQGLLTHVIETLGVRIRQD